MGYALGFGGQTIEPFAHPTEDQKITSPAQLIELTGKTQTPIIPVTILRADQEIKLTAKPGKLGVQLE